MENLSIPKSRGISIFVFFLSVLLVGLVILFLSPEEWMDIGPGRYRSPTLAYFIGALVLPISVVFVVISIKNLFDRTPGLMFSAQGIYDNSSLASAGLIPWREIKEIQVRGIYSIQLLAVFVVEPEKYLKKGSLINRFTKRQNVQVIGTPIGLSAQLLEISFSEMADIVHKQVSLRYSERG